MTGSEDNNGPKARPDGLAAFRGFYESRLGRTTRRLITRRMATILSDRLAARKPSGTVAGLGYARPYLQFLDRVFEQAVGLQSTGPGAVQWPRGKAGRLAVVDGVNLPVLPASLEALLLVHGLEHSNRPADLLEECWRVLESQGLLILVVPNRGSIWAGSEITPFGHGQPYSVNQIRGILEDHDFEVGRIHRALAVPPSNSFFYPRVASMVDRLPTLMGGVLIVEARKMIYSVRGMPAKEKKRILRPALTGIGSGFVPGTDSRVD